MASELKSPLEINNQCEEIPTPRQLGVLFRYISGHREMILDELSPNFSVPVRNWLWDELAFYLNVDDYGIKKSAHEWRKIWARIKFDVKTAAEERQFLIMNGEVNVPPLSPIYLKVAAFIENANSSVMKMPGESQVLLQQEHLHPFPKPSSSDATSAINMDAITTVLHTEFQHLAEKLTIKPLTGSESDDISNEKQSAQCDCKQETSQFIKAQNALADAILDFTDVFEQTNQIHEKQLLAQQENNKLISERNAIERIKNQQFLQATYVESGW